MSNPTTDQQGGINISNSTVTVAGNLVGRDYTHTQITNNFFTDSIQARNRRDMLELVTNTWIKGVLEQSLYNQVVIELGLQTQPGAVERAWDLQLQMPEQPARELPQGTPLIEIFDQLNGALLILGAPGAGKTTMLLQLARDLIALAMKDTLMRIPVILNLSSWSHPKQKIADWVVLALGTQYQVPKKLAQMWVEQDALLFFLDGLDEVKQDRQVSCVEALNAFRDEHGFVPLVVCSRIADYTELGTQLKLRGAVLIQPLTPAQIDAYLERAGPELSSVRHLLNQDTILRELAQQPLMLNVMTIAYVAVPLSELTSERLSTRESHRKHLFDAYVREMFHRVARTKNELCSPAQTKHWLSWLSKKMIEHGMTTFFLESLRKQWLPTSSQQRLATIILRLAVVLVFGLVALLVSGLVGGGLGGLLGGLGAGLVIALLVIEVEPEPAERVEWSWREAWRKLPIALRYGLGFGLAIGLVGGLIFWLSFQDVRALPISLLGGLGIGLFASLAILLGIVLKGSIIETKSFPNQGIKQSMKNAIVTWTLSSLSFGLLFAMGVGVFGMLTSGQVDAMDEALIYGMIAGVGVGLRFGGVAVINHYVVRFLLYRYNYIPLKYARFLDYASERVFLRKVGGGYIFIHRMLMEHFAAMEDAGRKDGLGSR